jgi:hypothetical protein
MSVRDSVGLVVVIQVETGHVAESPSQISPLVNEPMFQYLKQGKCVVAC